MGLEFVLRPAVAAVFLCPWNEIVFEKLNIRNIFIPSFLMGVANYLKINNYTKSVSPYPTAYAILESFNIFQKGAVTFTSLIRIWRNRFKTEIKEHFFILLDRQIVVGYAGVNGGSSKLQFYFQAPNAPKIFLYSSLKRKTCSKFRSDCQAKAESGDLGSDGRRALLHWFNNI